MSKRGKKSKKRIKKENTNNFVSPTQSLSYEHGLIIENWWRINKIDKPSSDIKGAIIDFSRGIYRTVSIPDDMQRNANIRLQNRYIRIASKYGSNVFMTEKQLDEGLIHNEKFKDDNDHKIFIVELEKLKQSIDFNKEFVFVLNKAITGQFRVNLHKQAELKNEWIIFTIESNQFTKGRKLRVTYLWCFVINKMCNFEKIAVKNIDNCVDDEKSEYFEYIDLRTG